MRVSVSDKSSKIHNKPAMEMPKALETVLSALLNNHTVTSWKVAAEPGNNPAVVIRLRPKRDSQSKWRNQHTCLQAKNSEPGEKRQSTTSRLQEQVSSCL